MTQKDKGWWVDVTDNTGHKSTTGPYKTYLEAFDWAESQPGEYIIRDPTTGKPILDQTSKERRPRQREEVRTKKRNAPRQARHRLRVYDETHDMIVELVKHQQENTPYTVTLHAYVDWLVKQEAKRQGLV